MDRRIPLLSALITIALGSCISLPPDSELADAGPEQHLEFDVDPSDAVEIAVGSGELSIQGAGAGVVSATLTIRCPRDSRSCEKWATEAQLVATRDRDRVRIALNKGAKTGVAVNVSVLVPKNLPLSVNMGYGDLTVRGLEDDVSIKMTAGAIKVEMPEDSVRNVHAAARFGDASIRVGGRTLDGKRAVLVGARLDWHEGIGTHDVDVAVRFGDAQVELYR